MVTEPILQHFDPERPVTIETDALDYAIGAICSQPDDNRILHPVAYYSRKQKDPERNYDIHDKELLAIIDATKMGYILQDNGTNNHDPDRPQKLRILEGQEGPQSTTGPVG